MLTAKVAGQANTGANSHLPVVSDGGFVVFLKMCARCNSGLRRFELFAHTTHTFCYDIACYHRK